MNTCPECSNVSGFLQCGHWSCRVCNFKTVKTPSNQNIMYMECEICKKHTILTENEHLYVLYLKRSQGPFKMSHRK